jgi:DNA-binding response OmpR family regulator
MFFGKARQTIRHVLIVEDEPLIAFDNERALMLGGFDVVATVDRMRDAEQVLHRDGGVDLVVADIRLRGPRTGVDLAVHAREIGVPVLFATASCPTEAREPGLALGWLAKPFSPRDLLRSVHICDRLLRGRGPGAVPAGLTLFPLAN